MLARYFGDMRLDDLTRPVLLEWWHAEIEGRGLSHGTGMVRLAMLSGVLGYAVDLELIPENAVDALRATLRRRRQSKRGRAEAASGVHVRPIGEPAELQAFVTASEAAHRMRFQNGVPKLQRRDGHVADLLQLDAGLRLGEVEGLRWGHIIWGDGPDDASRAIVISEAVARGKYQGPPKSGRSRRVGLPKRLRKLLREYWVAKGQPGPEERVLVRFNPQNYAARHFSEVCAAAKLEQRHTPKDLRDTFASQLLTAGVQLGYVSEQLGHSDVAVTAKHYAKWAGGSQYRQPLTVGAGELPADLIARIPEESPQKSPQLAEKHFS